MKYKLSRLVEGRLQMALHHGRCLSKVTITMGTDHSMLNLKDAILCSNFAPCIFRSLFEYSFR
jgi:hypothetical protein